jgi:hypothetical protein
LPRCPADQLANAVAGFPVEWRWITLARHLSPEQVAQGSQLGVVAVGHRTISSTTPAHNATLIGSAFINPRKNNIAMPPHECSQTKGGRSRKDARRNDCAHFPRTYRDGGRGGG